MITEQTTDGTPSPAPAAAPYPDGRSHGDSLAVLERFFVEEAAYIAAGGLGKASFDRLAECLHPDVVMYQAPGLPYGGTWRGPQGIEGFLAAMSETWESLEFLEQQYVVDGDTVVIRNRGRLRARGTGRSLETWVMQLMTIKDGLITEIHPFYWDTAAVAEVLRPADSGDVPG
ncbi:nuclear transport factor 2 family protein [Streptosporangium sp. NPDC000396]|uniref:nuclear transport factor 2 family protein n=1 Tax=Streptosporangium sp. NPDC000396 TaxID=3366185 RepID=UPI0036C4FE10